MPFPRVQAPLSFAVLLSSSLLFTGCTNAPVTTQAVSNHAITGKVFGGQQAITGATIQLYSVGTSTDGGPATPLLSTTVTTSDGTGQANSNANSGNANNTLARGYFNITGDYTCPSATSLVYLTATGGDSGSGSPNPQIANIAALGECGNLSSSSNIVINELTTVGSVAALYPYMTAYNAIGSTPAHAAALSSAFDKAAEYFNVSYGLAPGPKLPAGYTSSDYDVRSLANSIAACVNSTGGTYNDGTPCGLLFLYTKPSSGAAPTDTVTALIDIFNNPSNNVVNIFNLAATQSPFSPVDSSAPVDFSLPILPIPATPTFSIPAGSYTTAQTVSINETDPTAAIYYTTDGTTPTTASTLYSGPITIASAETLQAYAVESGRLWTPIAAATYNVSLTTGTVSLSSVWSDFGSTTAVPITAYSSANGSVVTFSTTGSATGTFSPSSCTIAGGSCTVSYMPDGTLAPNYYTNTLSAGFTAVGAYSASTATSTLAIGPGAGFELLAGFTQNGGAYPGSLPQSNLIQGSDGNFYGTTTAGGAGSYGTVFQISPTGTYTVLHSFSNAASDGNQPHSGLVEGTDGNFYGTTFQGGAYGLGTVYKITSSGAFTLLYSFGGVANDGQNPFAGLVQGTDGNFYGNTYNGGDNSVGTVFKMTPAGAVTILYSFANDNVDGNGPRGALVQATDGNFYGTTYNGSPNDLGIVYRISSTGAYSVIHVFAGAPSDGNSPESTLVEGADGLLYGTSYWGGSNDTGAAFSLSLDGATFNLLHSFTGGTDGQFLIAGLTPGSDGNFYGVTTQGGTNGYGVVFQLSPTGSSYNILRSFSAATTDGRNPQGAIVQGADGSLYGTTYGGGDSGFGTIYRYTPNLSYTAPVILSAPSMLPVGNAFTLTYTVANAYSASLRQCAATNTANDTTGWSGIKTGSPSPTNASLVAPAAAGTYTYTLTCGGQETGYTTVTVQ